MTVRHGRDLNEDQIEKTTCCVIDQKVIVVKSVLTSCSRRRKSENDISTSRRQIVNYDPSKSSQRESRGHSSSDELPWVRTIQATLFVTKKTSHKMWVDTLLQQLLELLFSYLTRVTADQNPSQAVISNVRIKLCKLRCNIVSVVVQTCQAVIRIPIWISGQSSHNEWPEKDAVRADLSTSSSLTVSIRELPRPTESLRFWVTAKVHFRRELWSFLTHSTDCSLRLCPKYRLRQRSAFSVFFIVSFFRWTSHEKVFSETLVSADSSKGSFLTIVSSLSDKKAIIRAHRGLHIVVLASSSSF